METKKNVSRNRTIALLLALVMAFAAMPTIVLASGTYAGIMPAAGGVYDSLVTTTIAALHVHSTSADSAYIDLHAETINNLPVGFVPAQFSVNGSNGRWRNIPNAGLDASLRTWLNSGKRQIKERLGEAVVKGYTPLPRLRLDAPLFDAYAESVYFAGFKRDDVRNVAGNPADFDPFEGQAAA